MKRFFGMMASACVKFERQFDTGDGLRVMVQAGEEGWTIIYADSSTKYQDVLAPTAVNFKTALAVLRKDFPQANIPEDP